MALSLNSPVATPNGFAVTTAYTQGGVAANLNDVLVATISLPAGTTASAIADNSGATSAWTPRASVVSGASDNLYSWWAKANSNFTGATVTVTLSGASVSVPWITAFAITGANTTAPFDGNGSLPASVLNGFASGLSLSTTALNTLIFGIYITQDATGVALAGWTADRAVTPEAFLIQHIVESSAQSGLNAGVGGSNNMFLAYADAVVAASGGGDTFANAGSLRFMREKAGELFKPVRKLLVPGWRPEPAFSF